MNRHYFDDPVYSMDALEGMRQRWLRHELKELRTEALERLEELEKAGYTDLKAYEANVGRHEVNINRLTNKELRYRITEVHQFLSSKFSTVEGVEEYEESMVEKLQNQGIMVNRSNLKDFGDFMDGVANIFGAALYDSRTLGHMYGQGVTNPAMAVRMYTMMQQQKASQG